MRIWQILRALENFEDTLAHYYNCLRLAYESDQETAVFFSRMRDEELSHRDIVRYEQRLMFKSPENYLDLDDYDQSALEQMMRTVEDLIVRSAHLTLDEALRASVRIEKAAAQQHLRSIIGRVNPALGRLVQDLGGRDLNHTERLKTFADSRGISLEL